MIGSVMLVSSVQQNDSVIHKHVSILFQVLFLFRVLQKTEQLLFEVGKPLRKTGFAGERKKQYWKLSFRCTMFELSVSPSSGDVTCMIRFVSLAFQSAQNSDVNLDVISTKVTLKPGDKTRLHGRYVRSWHPVPSLHSK